MGLRVCGSWCYNTEDLWQRVLYKSQEKNGVVIYWSVTILWSKNFSPCFCIDFVTLCIWAPISGVYGKAWHCWCSHGPGWRRNQNQLQFRQCLLIYSMFASDDFYFVLWTSYPPFLSLVHANILIVKYIN